MSSTAPIFNVQSLSTQDGPGLRTAVFFQGCPLRCTWCCNPEGQSAEPQLQWQSGRCQGCLECGGACSHGAVRVAEAAEKRLPQFDRAACRTCGLWSCVAACPNGALQRIGRLWTAEELLAVVKKDLRLYRNSGGGVTFTGGEPLLHSGFLSPIMRRLHDWCVSIAVETCGLWNWAEAAEGLRHCDLIFFDVKALDDEVHQRFTGRSNDLILGNLRTLAQTFGDRVVVTIPVVPGILDSADSIGSAGTHIRGLGLTRVRLLPYHQLGRGKYGALGLPYPHERWDVAVARSTLEAAIRRLTDLGLEATIEG